MKKFFAILIVVISFQNCFQPTTENKKEATIIQKDTISKDSILKPIPIKKIVEEIPEIDFDTAEFLEVIRLDSSIVLDLRYATTNNFMEEKVYECGRCFLRPEVAKAVVKAHQKLQEKGFGLKMYDCLRPRPIQWKLWNKVPNPKYVADPRKGSMHNRGAAVDLTIVDKNGKELNMGTDFDFFGREGWTFYDKLPKEVLENRKLLRTTLAEFNLKHIKTEWWHFSFKGKWYEISDFVWNCN